jgi:uncharacterized protein (DUF488 family)
MVEHITGIVPIYTIGYGNRTIDDFIELLKKHEIDFLVDIRSSPYSRFNPEFSKEALAPILERSGIRYVFMGDMLGGRPTDQSCYSDGKVDYQKCAERESYRQGISRLHKAWRQELHIVLMCSEAKPESCHRSKLVGETLHRMDVNILHIGEDGLTKTQQEVMRILTNGQISLFGPHPNTSMSRKRYHSANKIEES